MSDVRPAMTATSLREEETTMSADDAKVWRRMRGVCSYKTLEDTCTEPCMGCFDLADGGVHDPCRYDRCPILLDEGWEDDDE